MARKALSAILVSLVSTVASLAIAEFIASLVVASLEPASSCLGFDSTRIAASRLFSVQHAYYEPNSSISHCGPEFNYTYNIDELGLRHTSYRRASPRILAVGDSFTFGFGVRDDETFPALVGAHNAGIWSASFSTQHEAFRRDLPLIKPDVIIWAIYPPHVITMMPGAWDHNVPGDRILLTTKSASIKGFISELPSGWLADLAFTKLFLKATNIKAIAVDGDNVVARRSGYETKEIILFDKNIGVTRYSDFAAADATLEHDRDAVLTKMTEYFRDAKALADQQNARLFFLIIPSRLSLRLRDKTARVPSYTNAFIDPTLPTALVTEAIVQAGIPLSAIVDLAPLFVDQMGDWQRFYFKWDAHWNAAGHRLVADYLQERLSSVATNLRSR